MAQPLFCSQNLLNTRAFRSHTLTASEEATGFTVDRLANGRRSSGDYWAATSTATATITVTCDRIRGADFLWIDRGHNLAGRTVSVLASDDGFSSSQTVWSGTIPSSSSPGPLSAFNGAVTFDGSFAVTFGLEAAKWWRIQITAGGGVIPSINFAILGKAWRPPTFDLPWSEDRRELMHEDAFTESGWITQGRLAVPRRGVISCRLDSQAEYVAGLEHVLGHYIVRRPAALCFDADDGLSAFLAVPPAGEQIGFEYRRDWWGLRSISIPYIEHQPQDAT